MTNELTNRIDRAFEAEDWATARKLLVRALRTDSHDHWLLTRLATTYYEDRDYRAALEWSRRALAEAPHCPLVLWDYAGALDMLGRESEAIRVWRKLIRRGAKSLAAEECGEGIRWARSLVNDSRYRAALSLADQGRAKEAAALLSVHLRNRGPRCPSIYSQSDVRKKAEVLSTITNGARRRHVGETKLA